MQKALKFNPETKFLSVAWSSPTWMKTNNRTNGFGTYNNSTSVYCRRRREIEWKLHRYIFTYFNRNHFSTLFSFTWSNIFLYQQSFHYTIGFLKKEYYELYCDYLLKFLDEYEKNGLNMWAISTGNEPLNAYIPIDRLSSLGWTPKTMADWVGNFLGPILAASRHNETQILALDDQRLELPWFMMDVFLNEKAKKYIAGTALHWYTDFFTSPKLLDWTHQLFPDKFIFMTEACTGKLRKHCYPR